MSRSASEVPRSPATVEKRINSSVFFANFRENHGLGIAGDILGNGKDAISAGSLGVHAPLGNDLPIEVGEFLQKPDILQELRAALPGGEDVLVVRNRCTESRG